MGRRYRGTGRVFYALLFLTAFISFGLPLYRYINGRGDPFAAVEWLVAMVLANLLLFVIGIADAILQGTPWAVWRIPPGFVIFLATLFLLSQVDASRERLAIRQAEVAVRNTLPEETSFTYESSKNNSGIWLVAFRTEDGTRFLVALRDHGRTLPLEMIKRTGDGRPLAEVVYQADLR